jgi:hypothetical protein
LFGRPARRLAVIALAAIWVTAPIATATEMGASAAVGPGTYTKITTPSHTTIYKWVGSGTNQLTVSGLTSADVTAVDIDCIYSSSVGRFVVSLANDVPVAGGSFSVNAALQEVPTNCRLRAIPSSVDPATDYLGSYNGPIFYSNAMLVDKDGATEYGFLAIGEQGDGMGEIEDAVQCGSRLLATIDAPAMQLSGPGSSNCSFVLPFGNITRSGNSTASSIRVDGHNAYLPAVVHNSLRGSQGLTVQQSKLTTSFSRAANGDVTVTESAPLLRCSQSDSYPPTQVSCPNLVGTGVKFSRVSNIFRGAHEIRLRDTFTSTDSHAHTVNADYELFITPPDAGATGYTFPGHGSAFNLGSPDEIITGLGTKAGTVFVRSDFYSAEGDESADTIGLTWSRAPSKLQFSHTSPSFFFIPYALSVPAGRSSRLGFAESEAPLTSDARARASVAVNEMVSTPVISTPADHGSISGTATTVKGTVALGANGLPTSVAVNGRAAQLSVNASRTQLGYSVTFNESLGTHQIKVIATDSAGNTKSKSITVTNT